MPETQTTVGGLRAIELNFRPMRDINTGRSISFLSRTHLNSPGLGVLMPETFRPAADISGQAQELFHLEMLRLAESAIALKESDRIFEWLSLDMPLSILKDRASTKILETICDQFSLSSGKFAFVIPETVLLEQDSTAAENIAFLRRLGYHMILSSFGENGCPFMKLSEYTMDYVMLSPSVTNYINKTERGNQAVHSIISFINELGCDPIADGVKNSVQAEILYSFGCNYCAGSLCGEYISLAELTE